MKTGSTKFHVGINVARVDSSVNFYRELFRKEPVKVKADYAKFETDEVVLSLIQSPDKVQPEFGHFGLRVENQDQLREHQARLAGNGHQLLEEEGVDCCYAIQDKFWVKDPDGYDWEVYTFLEDSNDSIRPDAAKTGVAVAETVCCGPECC